MAVHQGDLVLLTIEKPAAGGRMLARHEGQVVLVQGGIPGERVRARIGRVERQLAFADTVDVLEPSADRRQPAMDPACGGCLYAHIEYDRQRALKAELVRDAFGRLGRIAVDLPDVAASPERGYRMRARLHVRGDRIGFYREGTHELCDAAATGQMDDRAIAATARAVESLAAAGCGLSALELTENMAGDERVLHVLPADGSTLSDRALDEAMAAGGLTGCTGRSQGVARTAGVPVVIDPLSALTGGAAGDGGLQRHVESFFQANRYLLPGLVTSVMAAIPADGAVLDLYAGVGLFSVCLAATGRTGLTAVEGDRMSGRDLTRNAAPYTDALRVSIASVEDHLMKRRLKAAAILVDPPRTGMSREAMQAIIAVAANRIVYVSCDPATMARDARRLLDGGYELASLAAFDLFPNTPHVESLGVFVRGDVRSQKVTVPG